MPALQLLPGIAQHPAKSVAHLQEIARSIQKMVSLSRAFRKEVVRGERGVCWGGLGVVIPLVAVTGHCVSAPPENLTDGGIAAIGSARNLCRKTAVYMNV